MKREHLTFGSTISVVLGFGLMFGAKFLGPVTVIAPIGGGLIGLGVIGFSVARIMGLVSQLKR